MIRRFAYQGAFAAASLGLALLLHAQMQAQTTGPQVPELLPPLSPARPLPAPLPAPSAPSRPLQTPTEELPAPPTGSPPSVSRPDEPPTTYDLPTPTPSRPSPTRSSPTRPGPPASVAQPTPEWSSTLRPQPLELDDVREMAAAGLDATIIKEIIKLRGLDKPLSVQDLIWLKQHDVSNDLIQELQVVAPRGLSVDYRYGRIDYGLEPRGHSGAPLPVRLGPRGPAPYPTPAYRPHTPRPVHRYQRRIPTRRGGRLSLGIGF